MMGGMIAGGFAPGKIIAADPSLDALRAVKDKLSVKTTANNRRAARQSRLIFLTVKPQYYNQTIAEIRDIICVDCDKILITVAPGWTLARVQDELGKPAKIIRTMPNTPALVGEGMTAYCPNDLLTPEEIEEISGLLAGFGQARQLPEHLFDAFTALCGSSPAFVFMMIEAMADAAVLEGFPRALAYSLASQAVLGSAKMVRDLELHPGILKDMVCSPGGSTIEGVRSLEESGLRAAFIKALAAAAQKAKSI